VIISNPKWREYVTNEFGNNIINYALLYPSSLCTQHIANIDDEKFTNKENAAAVVKTAETTGESKTSKPNEI
jgi:hypothetical protein